MVTPSSCSMPMDAVVFDCDGTLTSIEGIDRLAEYKKVGTQVSTMTAEAMGKTGLTPLLYEARLNLVKPSMQDLQRLAQDYRDHQTPDILSVIEKIHTLNKKIYLISAGLLPAISAFAVQLGIPKENVFAVDVRFDSEGNYLDFDRASPLIHNSGKKEILTQLKQKHPRLLFVGDGLNDLAAKDIVTRFVGYGGAFYRENIQKQSEYYITSKSMVPLLKIIF